MTTINVSLPDKLKDEAQMLVESGFYASFSDLVRDSLRQAVKSSKYDLWTLEAEKEFKEGKGKLLKSPKDIDEYFESL